VACRSDRESLAQAGHLSIALGRSVGRCRGQLRFLNRQLVCGLDDVAVMGQSSSMAVVILASPKTCGQSANARLVVMSSDVFS